jgi:hypothetical protein
MVNYTQEKAKTRGILEERQPIGGRINNKQFAPQIKHFLASLSIAHPDN